MIPVTKEVKAKRRKHAKQYVQTPGIESSIRMIWGNVQEATALLTALNYFWKQDPQIILKEVGMCGAGLQLNQTSKILVGATPDALLYHPDGTVEAVEVKNHCPFLPSYGRQPKRHAFRLGELEFSHGVLPHYVPQLMMEMLCVGKECKSAIMVRQSATNGSLILRIHRDDDWIDEMMYWLNRFYEDYVEPQNPPPINFFIKGSSPEDIERYKTFLERTKQLEQKVELLSHIPNKEIQRAIGTSPGVTNLFLD